MKLLRHCNINWFDSSVKVDRYLLPNLTFKIKYFNL